MEIILRMVEELGVSVLCAADKKENKQQLQIPKGKRKQKL